VFEGRRGDGSLLTGGGRLAGIDVADNDHVDMHLFLTADTRDVSQESIKIDAIVAIILTMLLMEEDADVDVDSPHGCGIEFSSVLCGSLCFLREEVESGGRDVSKDNFDVVLDEILTRRVIA
jgi:hypothetical protein